MEPINLDALPDYLAHAQLYPLISVLREKRRIIIIAGAGISASAGIPTFDTIQAKDRGLFNIRTYNSGPETTLLNEFLCRMFRQIVKSKPTQFHLMIAALAEEGRLRRLYTQNIDGIDTQLPSLRTSIPLPEKKPWPKTIQLHGDLRTVRCEKFPSTHLSRFEPASFSLGNLPLCADCEKDEHLNTKAIPIMRPRIWMYDDMQYPDKDAIDKVRAADIAAKPDAVIVVGTALKVKGARRDARDLCRAVRANGGFTAWINLKAPPKELDCLDLVVTGDCEKVAMHVSSWWLKECPSVLNDAEIQKLQKKCKLFITKSPEAALNRALVEVDDNSLTKILQQKENKSRILRVREHGQPVFTSIERSQPSGSSNWKAVNEVAKPVVQNAKGQPLKIKSFSPSDLGVLPILPDCWRREMSERLSNIVVREGRESSSAITTISNLGYKHEAYLSDSLWRLKPGEWLNDDIINAYLELLRKRGVADQSIESTGILNMAPDSPWRKTNRLIEIGKYSIFVPINKNGNHWTFAIIMSEKKGDPIRWEYYDSCHGAPPQLFLDWLHRRFTNPEKRINSSRSPKQRNGADCGLFVLIGIRLMSAGRRHLSQIQSDAIMPTFRQRVLAELLASSLNPSSAQFEEFKLREAQANIGPSEVNAAEKTRGRSTSTDSSELSIFSRTPTPGVEMISTCALDESEEEFVEVQTSIQKSHIGKKSPERIATTFAEEATMLRMLKQAVSSERASQIRTRSRDIENMALADLWLMISTEKRSLKQRHVHYEFSRRFWAEMEMLHIDPHQHDLVRQAIISQVMSELKVMSHTNWKYVMQLARRASVWTELAEIFKNELDHPSVVLCAIPDATYILETMTLTNRKVLFDSIRSALKVPGNMILARLKAADALYWALMHGNLPASELPIENNGKDLPFEKAVSIR